MKVFSAMCVFQGGRKSMVNLAIGSPDPSHHPLHFQSVAIGAKGGAIPNEIMEALDKIKEVAYTNNIPFEDLCYYAMTVANGTAREDAFDTKNDIAKFDEILESINSNDESQPSNPEED